MGLSERGVREEDGDGVSARHTLAAARQPAIDAPRTTDRATPPSAPGKHTRVHGIGAPLRLESRLASIAQKTDVLARAIEALNYFDAWSASLDLRREITYAESQLHLLDATERAAAAGELHALTDLAQQQIARAPSPSKTAIQEVTSIKDRHAARPTWDAEKRAWLAAHAGSVAGRSAGGSESEHAPGLPPRGQGQRGPAGAARPDLGNYHSRVGKRVLVLRDWDDAAIAARRVELQGQLSRTTELKARDELLTEYQAIEWVAHERGLSLPKDPGEEAAPQACSGGKPIKFWVPETAQGMRAMLEREMVAGGGYESARDHAQLRIGYGTLPQSETNHDKRVIGDQQIALMDHDAAAFRSAFQVEAKQTALSMLDASTAAIDAALRSYGIASGSFRLTDAAHEVARDPGMLDAELDKWVALSSRLDDNRAAYAAGHGKREDLAREAKQLRDLQDGIAALASEQLRLIELMQTQHPEHPGMPRPARQPDWRAVGARSTQLRPMRGSAPTAQNPFDEMSAPAAEPPEQRLEFVRGALRARQAQFQAAWIQAERQHPVLAAYRGNKPPDASSLADLGSDEATTRSVVRHVLPKLGHIYRTKAALLGSWGALDPLQLAPAVELTKQRMFVAQGTTRDRVVHDMVALAHEKDGLAQWALEAVMIGLTLVTLMPSAGASATAGLALTGLAYDLYVGMGEYEDVRVMSTAADTDLDKLRSLSDLEPSLTPLLTRIVSAGVNLTVAASLFKRAVGLRRMATSGKVDSEALAALNRAGDTVGVTGVGDEAGAHETARGTASRKVAAGSELIEVRGLAQRPHLKWTKNADGSVRSIDQAIEIARQNGVEIEDDILLRKVSGKFLPEQTYAEYFRARLNDPSQSIRWNDFFSKELDLLLVRVEQSVFESDEAIVAVLGHEMHELNSLRRLFEQSGGTMTYRQLHYLISPGIKGNLHDQAWDIADQLVLAMRQKSGVTR